MGWQDIIMIVSTTAKFNSNMFWGVCNLSTLKEQMIQWSFGNDYEIFIA